MRRVDYDRIAPLYDDPIRDHPADPFLGSFLASRPHASRTVRVLDVGCGTGKQLTSDRARYPSLQLVGVDRSRGMLTIARQRCPDVSLVQADAAALPFATSSFDYVSCQFAHAHFDDKSGWLREVARVLVAGGRFVQVNIDPWAMQDWFVYRYFPAALERDRHDFVEYETLLSAMQGAGFVEVQAIRDVQRQEWTVAECLAYASSRHRVSQLGAISDEQYACGLATLTARAALTDAPPMERFTFCIVTCVATRAGRG